MVRHVLLTLTVLISACGNSKPHIKCSNDAQCTLAGRPGVCIESSCAIADASCASGYRYDTTAGGTGDCVPVDVTNADMTVDDMDTNMTDDLSTSNDLTVTVTGPDLSSTDLASHTPMWSTATVSGGPTLLAVWGTSATNIYITYTANAANAPVLHSTGNGAWAPQSTTPAEVCSYEALWGSSATNIYAAGSCSAPSVSAGDGTWNNNQTVPAGFGSEFRALWGSSNMDIYASADEGVILHSTGNGSWVAQTSGANTSSSIGAIWGSSSTNIYAVVSTGSILHSTGTGSWTGQTSGTSAALMGLWGKPDGSAIYAVGGNGTQSVVLKSTGNGTWTPQTIPSLSVYLRSVWGTPDGANVWVVGDGGTILYSSGGGAFVAQTSTPATTSNLFSVWGSGAGDVYAVGANGTILHYQ